VKNSLHISAYSNILNLKKRFVFEVGNNENVKSIPKSENCITSPDEQDAEARSACDNIVANSKLPNLEESLDMSKIKDAYIKVATRIEGYKIERPEKVKELGKEKIIDIAIKTLLKNGDIKLAENEIKTLYTKLLATTEISEEKEPKLSLSDIKELMSNEEKIKELANKLPNKVRTNNLLVDINTEKGRNILTVQEHKLYSRVMDMIYAAVYNKPRRGEEIGVSGLLVEKTVLKNKIM